MKYNRSGKSISVWKHLPSVSPICCIHSVKTVYMYLDREDFRIHYISFHWGMRVRQCDLLMLILTIQLSCIIFPLYSTHKSDDITPSYTNLKFAKVGLIRCYLHSITNKLLHLFRRSFLLYILYRWPLSTYI